MTARQQVADARGLLRAERAEISTESNRLARLQRQITGAKQTIAKSTIPGTGTFLVATDIAPGTYRADANAGCYWARLASLDRSNIIDNDNADGPVVVQISSSDKAFEANGCADFHKIGP